MTAVVSRRQRTDPGGKRHRRLAQPADASRIWCAAALIASSAVIASLQWQPRPLLLWNASASSTVGLYFVTSAGGPRVGDMVVAWPSTAARRLAAARRYLPANVPLVKRVAAASGDRVCAQGETIIVNGRVAAVRRSRDPSGRTMPWWSGCEILRADELFLLSPATSNAFDGRYFGVTRVGQLIGRARLLWAKPPKASGDG